MFQAPSDGFRVRADKCHCRVNMTFFPGMKSLIPNVVLCTLISVLALLAQQDSTVQWKTTLQDLEHRLTALPSEGAPVEAWRSEAEALRADIVSFADSNPGLKLQLPEALSRRPIVRR